MTTTIAITAVAIVICASGIFRVGRRHPGHRAANGMVSVDNGTTIEFAEPEPIPADVPVYPVERPTDVTSVDLPRYVDPHETHEIPYVDDFYEEDEDPEKVQRLFDEGVKVRTAHPLESYCPQHPREPCTCPDDVWMIEPVTLDELVAEIPLSDDDPDRFTWSGDDTVEWEPVQEAQLEDLDAATTAEFQRFWDGDEEENDPNWVHGLREGTANSRAVRRLKSLFKKHGWTDVTGKPETPRNAGKRHKKRTLGQRLDLVEIQRERVARKRRHPEGRHRLTEAQEQEAHGVDDDQAGT